MMKDGNIVVKSAMHSCVPVVKLPSEEDEDLCPVCFDTMAPPATPPNVGDTIQLQCGHTLHTQCLADMLGSGVAAGRQGITLVHYCPRRKHFLRDT